MRSQPKQSFHLTRRTVYGEIEFESHQEIGTFDHAAMRRPVCGSLFGARPAKGDGGELRVTKSSIEVLATPLRVGFAQSKRVASHGRSYRKGISPRSPSTCPLPIAPMPIRYESFRFGGIAARAQLQRQGFQSLAAMWVSCSPRGSGTNGDARAFAGLIKADVMDVIINEKRPGGTLYG